jgi:hypothetical protein
MNTETNITAASRDTAQALWQKWTALWNGDLSLAEQILAADLTVHAAVIGTDDAAVQGAHGMIGWITQLRALLSEPTFTVQVGPVIDGNLLCGRWQVHGRYAGEMPGATAVPGTPVVFTGTDVLRIENALLAEYWVNSDVHVMAAQLGLTA